MRLLNLNLYRGKCLHKVIEFINQEQFDIVQLQEVGWSFSFPQEDCFQIIQQKTGLCGELLVTWYHKKGREGYFGNATFFNPSLQLKKTVHLHFKPVLEIPDPALLPIEEHPKGALFLCFETHHKPFWCINTHLAWGPTPLDKPYKIEDAQFLSSHIQALAAPFLLSGDFNVQPDTEVVKILESHGRNLTKEWNISNTLNAKLHRATHLFPPGLAVDYIITHPSLHIHDFQQVDHDLSDHMGLIVEFSI